MHPAHGLEVCAPVGGLETGGQLDALFVERQGLTVALVLPHAAGRRKGRTPEGLLLDAVALLHQLSRLPLILIG